METVDKATKSEQEAENLDAVLATLVKDPTPEIKSALNTLGVKEYLGWLADSATKRCHNKRLVALSFILGVYIAQEHRKLDNIYNKEVE